MEVAVESEAGDRPVGIDESFGVTGAVGVAIFEPVIVERVGDAYGHPFGSAFGVDGGAIDGGAVDIAALEEVRDVAQFDGTLDAVIAQNPGHLMRSAVRLLRARSDARDPIASQGRVRI